MATRMLWRLDGAAQHQVQDLVRLQQGLRLHLQHTDLLCALVQIGSAQQAYISAVGCDGCSQGRCLPGCYLELLRRLVKQSIPTSQLQLVPRGLAPRPYARLVLARPSAEAQPLDGALLHHWDEARLLMHWERKNDRIEVAALLAVGTGGLEPETVLAGYGWSSLAVPPIIARRIARQAIPARVPFHRLWTQAPMLLLPAGSSGQGHARGPPATAGCAWRSARAA